MAEKAIFSNISPDDSGIFNLAKQMDKANQAAIGETCVRNDAGKLSVSYEEKMKAWIDYYARLLNVEFEWESDLLLEVVPVNGTPPPVYMDPIHKALRKMKCGEAAGPLGIIVSTLSTASSLGLEPVCIRDLFSVP